MVFMLQAAGAEDGPEARRKAAVQLARENPRAGLAVLRGLLQEYPQDVLLRADAVVVANWADEDRMALELYQQHPGVGSHAEATEAAARSARNLRDLELAASLFRRAVNLAPERWQPRLGLALTLAEEGKADEAEPLLEALLLEQPTNAEALAGSAHGFGLIGKPVRALAAYQAWLDQEPDRPEARDGAALALSRLGGGHRATELSAPATWARIEAASSLARQRTRWGQSYAPTRLMQKEESTAALAQIEHAEGLVAQARPGLSAGEGPRLEAISRQLAYDRMVVLRDLLRMDAVVECYGNLPADRELPAYVREAVADAYLALRAPDQSGGLYLALVEEMPELATPWIGLAYSQLELENPRGAMDTMEEALRRSPIWLEAPGLRTPQANPDHEMIETQAALMLSFTEDLPASQERLEHLRDEAPANTSIREALARAYLARGWPIRGEDELRIAQTFEPDEGGVLLALAEVLEAQGRRDEGDAIVLTLMSISPDQERMANFLAERDTDRGWKVELGTVQGFGNGAQVGTDDHLVETRVESPLLDNRWGLFVNQLYHAADYAAGDSSRQRIGGGVSYDYAGKSAWLGLSRDDGSAENPAIVEGGGSLALGDHWRWQAGGSSSSLRVPLQAALRDIQGYGGETSLTWRQSERRSLQAGAAFTRFDDDNDRGQVFATWQERLFTTPKLKLESRLLGYGSFNTGEDRAYFNPRRDAELGPWMELDWLTARHYDFEFHQYFAAYGGAYWQEDYGTGPAFSARYGQRWQLEYGTAITVGVIYSRRPYDGEQEDRVALEFGFEWGGK